MSAPAAAVSAAADAGGEHEEQQEAGHGEEGDGSPKQAVNLGEDEKTESGPVTAPPIVARGFQESGGVAVEHILPDSPFASTTNKEASAPTAQNGGISNGSPHHVASSPLFPPAPAIELPPYNSCFFQAPRFSPGHEAIGL
ncbi:Zinc finger CCCH domain-containing protein 46 [Zea mays]|nr:Zinc finger CCCH domain-containing protein 46 [Zea mays]